MEHQGARSGAAGRWLTEDDYACAGGLGPGQARELIRKAGLLMKTAGGRDYVWVDDPDKLFAPENDRPGGTGNADAAGDAAPGADSVSVPDTTAPDALAPGRGPEQDEEVIESDCLPARFSGVTRLALQTERAISLVERSLNTFIMMHQEVVAEKDRFSELHREGMSERDRLIEEANARAAELELRLRDKDQEIADLRMLVEVMESGRERDRTAPVPAGGAEKASVGDLMEEQLRYLMEDQMVRSLLDD